MSRGEELTKKRKRSTDSPSKNSKKRVAVERTPRPYIKVSHIANGSSTINAPVIASAAGLSIPHKASFQLYHRPLYRSRHGRNEELLLHSSDRPRIDYTAREQHDGSASSQLRHYVGVFDPAQATLQVVEARDMNVRMSLRSEREEQSASQKDTPQAANYTQRQELGLEFGTKKAKKTIAAASQNAIFSQKQRDLSPSSQQAALKRDPNAAAVLQSMASATEGAPTREMMQAANDETKPRPKINIDAKELEDAYHESEIFGDQVLAALKVKPWVDAVNEDQAVEVSSKYVAHRLATFVREDEIKRLKMLKYVLLLVNFMAATQKGRVGKERRIPKRDELMEKLGESESVVEIVKQRFTNGLGTMTSWHIDKLITHLAAATHIIDDFVTDIYDLCEDTGVKITTMRTYFLEIAAKVTPLTETERMRMQLNKGEASMHRIAKLKLPLELPKDRKRFKQQGR